MRFSKLLLVIGFAIIAFWVISGVFKITFFLIHGALGIGLIVVVIALIQYYLETREVK